MSWILWFTRNWADTDEETGDPVLAPVDLPFAPGEALARVEAVIGQLPFWQVGRIDATLGVVCATRRTSLFGFIDDITVRVEATPTGSRIHARSQARVGVGDLGQNRRNLLELLARLRA
jgi:uncharacterized protein (DUF1499 family)